MESAVLHTGPLCGHDHLVEFYETEEFLVDTVCTFAIPALRGGDAGIVVAAPTSSRASAATSSASC